MPVNVSRGDNTIGIVATWSNEDFNKGYNIYVTAIANASSVTQQAAGGITMKAASMAGLVGGAFSKVADIVGNVFMSAINRVSDGISDMAGYVWNATAELQMLTVAIETLAGRELVFAGQAETINEALAKTGPIAQVILERLRDLALTSPFQYEDIVKTVRMNVAFGQTTETSIRLTEALLNMTAGMGLSSQFLERIAYNFSQMSLYGKVTARDVRDLAWAGVDLGTVFRTTLGMSIDQVNEALENGTIVFKDLTEAFIKYSEENFGTAAERMQKTLAGLGVAFHNLRFFTIQQVFGPSMQIITEELGKLFDKGRKIIESEVLLKIGAALSLITEAAINLAKNGIPFVLGKMKDFYDFLMEKVFGVMRDSSQDSEIWGFELIVNYVAGIYNAVGSVLVEAMNFISSVLEFFLAPKSPPEVAPDIIEWGKKTMELWIEGMTMADFGVLKSMQGIIESALGSLVNIGDLSKIGAAGAKYNILASLIGGLATGDYSVLFSELKKSTGEYSDELIQLMKSELDLAEATERLTLAQEALNNARKQQEITEGNVNKLVYEYNQALRMGATAESLRAKRAEIDAAIEARDTAREQVEETEKNLDVYQAQVDFLKESVNLQKEMLQAMIDLTNAMADYKSEQEALEDVKAVEPEVPELPEMADVEDPAKKVEEYKDELIKKLQELREKWNELTSGTNQEIESAWTRLWNNIKTIWDLITADLTEKWNNIKKMAGVIWQGIKDVIGGIIDGVKLDFDGWKEFFAQWWEDHGESVRFVANMMWEWLKGVWETVVGFLKRQWDEMVSQWSVVGEFFGKIFKYIADLLPWMWEAFKYWWELIITYVKMFIDGMGAFLDFWVDLIHRKWSDAWTHITDFFEKWSDIFMNTKMGKWLTSIRDVIAEKLKEVKEQHWDVFWDNAQNKVGEIIDGIKIKLGEIAENIKKALSDAWNNFASFDWFMQGWELAASIANGIWGGIWMVVQAALDLGSSLIQAIKDALLQHSPSEVGLDIGSNFGNSIIAGMVNAMAGAGQIATDMISGNFPSSLGTGYSMTPALQSASTSTVTNNANRNVNINISGVSISNGMDLENFKSVIATTVRDELKR